MRRTRHEPHHPRGTGEDTPTLAGAKKASGATVKPSGSSSEGSGAGEDDGTKTGRLKKGKA